MTQALTQTSSIGWAAVQKILVRHFIAASQQAVISDVLGFPNSFEQWFTAESISALVRAFPASSIHTNEDFLNFSKPDIALTLGEFVCVMEMKHLTPLSRECRGRWNGAKVSTVAKDICALHSNSNNLATKRVMVFYGPAQKVNHPPGGICSSGRSKCLACSIVDLQSTVSATCNIGTLNSRCIQILQGNQGKFFLLVFAV